MKKDRVCRHCTQIVQNVHGREFANHVRWCSKNPDRNKGLDKIGEANKKACAKRFGGEYKNFLVTMLPFKLL